VSDGSAGATAIGIVVEGNATRNTVLPGSLSNPISPPIALTMLRHTDSPSPGPAPTGLVVTNASNTRAPSARGMPRPVSRTSITTRFVASTLVAIVIS
jgi:hypothetical protein